MLLNDKAIRDLCVDSLAHLRFQNAVVNSVPFVSMIEPFSEAVSGNGVISYGLSHAGYDLRLGPEILLFKNSYNEVIDPKKFNSSEYRNRVFDEINLPDTVMGHRIELLQNYAVTIPPHGYILGRSYEYLRIPRHLKGRCVGKSTLARSGIIINTTPLEPGWEGHLTIEIGNITPCPAKVYVMEGIAQLEFELLTDPPEKDYAAKGGKYQNQVGVVPARVL